MRYDSNRDYTLVFVVTLHCKMPIQHLVITNPT